MKQLVYFIIFLSIINGCKSNYNKNEIRVVMNYKVLNPEKVAIDTNGDTVYVYDSILKYLHKMKELEPNAIRNNSIFLKILLKVKEYNRIIEIYSKENLANNKSISQEIIMGIALYKTDNEVLSNKHFDNVLNIINNNNNYKDEIKPFYNNYINYLKNKDYKTFKQQLNSPQNNPIYNLWNFKSFFDNLDTLGNTFDDFIYSINDRYNSPFLPIEEY